MKRYAKLDDFNGLTVREIIIVPDGLTIEKMYPASFVRLCLECGKDVLPGWSCEGGSFLAPPEPELPTVQEAYVLKIAEIFAGQAAMLSAIKQTYPDDEREGWAFKLQEAVEILAGSQEPAPYIDAELLGSGGIYASRTELARKIIEKNSGFKAYSGFINGQQTAMYHALEALVGKPGVTSSEVAAFPVNYRSPAAALDMHDLDYYSE